MQYFIKQKVFSLKDKFSVTNFDQEEVYKVEGKMFSLKNKLTLFSPQDEVVLYAEKKLFRIFPEYTIFSNEGQALAVVKKKFALRPKYMVTEGNNEIIVEGNFFAHSFNISKNGKQAASISKKIFSFGDSYEIDVMDENNLTLYLFIVIVIDQVAQAAERAARNASN